MQTCREASAAKNANKLLGEKCVSGKVRSFHVGTPRLFPDPSFTGLREMREINHNSNIVQVGWFAKHMFTCVFNI